MRRRAETQPLYSTRSTTKVTQNCTPKALAYTGIALASFAAAFALAAFVWTAVQQPQLSDARSDIAAQQVELNNTLALVNAQEARITAAEAKLLMQEMVIDSLVMPMLNETVPLEIRNATLTAEFSARAFTSAGPPPSGSSQDANWDGSPVVVGQCQLVRYNIGGIAYGTVRFLPFVSPPLAADSTRDARIDMTCDDTLTDLSPLDPPIFRLDPTPMVFDPPFTATNNEGYVPGYPLVNVAAGSDDVEWSYQIHSHNSLCGSANAICNTVPAGTTVTLAETYERLILIGGPA